MNSDNVKGTLKDLGGKAQRAVGEATGDSDLEAQGTANQAEGKTQNAWGNIKKEARDLKEDVKDAFNKHGKRDVDSADTDIDRDVTRRRDDVA
jgi:uncharacterized protein YjbJ (UPF0337 family)